MAYYSTIKFLLSHCWFQIMPSHNHQPWRNHRTVKPKQRRFHPSPPESLRQDGGPLTLRTPRVRDDELREHVLRGPQRDGKARPLVKQAVCANRFALENMGEFMDLWWFMGCYGDFMVILLRFYGDFMVIYGDVTKKKADIFMGNSLSMEAWGGKRHPSRRWICAVIATRESSWS